MGRNKRYTEHWERGGNISNANRRRVFRITHPPKCVNPTGRAIFSDNSAPIFVIYAHIWMLIGS